MRSGVADTPEREEWKQAAIFPIVSELALRATLGILARTVVPRSGSRGDGAPGPASSASTST